MDCTADAARELMMERKLERPDKEQRRRPVESRSERLDVRLTRTQKELLQRAAGLTGRGVSDFVVKSALDRAEETIQAHEIIELSERDARVLFEALQNPPKPNEKLREAMRRHREDVEMR